MKLEIGKIVGAATQSGWGQVHTFTPEEKDKIVSRGQFLATLSLGGLIGKDKIAAAGKEIIARLHEEYYGDLSQRPFLKLKEAVSKVSQEAEAEAQIEVVAASLVSGFLYLAIAGKGRIVLQRKGKVAPILIGQSDSIETASGRLENGDLFLLGTSKFFEIVPQGIIQAALATGSADQAAETLTPAVYGREDEGLAAAVLAEVRKEEPQQHLKFKLPQLKEVLKKITSVQKPRRSPRSLLTVVLILFLLLGVSVVLGSKQRNRFLKTSQWRQILDQAKAKKEEGEALLSLNPAKSRQLLLEAQAILGQVKEESASPDLLKLKKELEEALVSVLKEYQVAPKIIFDLELIKAGARGDDLTFASGQLLVLDKNQTAAYTVNPQAKKSAIVAGGKDLADASQIAGFLSKVYVFSSQGIIQADKDTREQLVVIKTDKDWQKIIDLGVFGGNLYLLDWKTIWQYLPTEKGFSAKRNWLKTETDLNQTVSMAIDGSIWLLKSDGQVWKFVRGVKENFTITGLSQPLANPKAIFTDAEQQRLYLLESSRVVVLNKTGEYQGQYGWKDINPSNLIVSEKDKKIFLLAGSKIYEIELK